MRWSFQSEDAVSALRARTDLLAYLTSRATTDSDVESAVLVFGELVGNVVRHAPGPISIEVEWQNGAAVLRVLDCGPGFDFTGASRPDLFSECGRGLYIVDQIAEQLEIVRLPKGTQATAYLPVRKAG
jgi:anti-sigma regulatory factor (Ser/Thr protein kinase)